MVSSILSITVLSSSFGSGYHLPIHGKFSRGKCGGGKLKQHRFPAANDFPLASVTALNRSVYSLARFYEIVQLEP
jgi:hypothetical protein